MSANDNFSLNDDEELSLHDDASLDGSLPTSNKRDAPANHHKIILQTTLSNIKLPVLQKNGTQERVTKGKDSVTGFFLQQHRIKNNLTDEERKESLETLYLDQIDDLDLKKWIIIWRCLTDIRLRSSTRKTGRKAMTVRTEKEALMTIDEGQINWVEQTTDEELNHALMAFTVNNEVLGYEEEISRGIFAFRETNAGYNDIPLYSRFKQVEYKGVPHPLSGDYTPGKEA
ncbi:hypothetical protein Tco_0818807 [Tanacetum coccineum]